MSGCRRAQRVMEARDLGEPLPAAELAFLGDHVKACDACALEERAFGALRFAAAEPSHFVVSADKRHDLVERAVVAAAWPTREPDDERAVHAGDGDVRPRWWTPLFRPRFALALAGVTAGLLALVVVLSPSSSGEAVRGTVVLAAGAGEGPRAGKPVVLEEEIVADAGELAVALGLDVVAVLEPGSRLRVRRLDTAGIDLELARGMMHVSATPGALAEALTVDVPDGRVVVTGTIFTVAAAAAGSDVRVQRGSVRVEPRTGAPAALTAGHGRGIGGGVERALPADEAKRALEAVGRAERLARAPEGAVLVVVGEPAGADVVVGGVRLGSAPLSLRLPPGPATVAVLVDGQPVKSESVTLQDGSERRIEYRVERGRGAAGDGAAIEEDADDTGDEGVLGAADEDVPDEDQAKAKRPRRDRRGAQALDDAEAMLERAQTLRAERRWDAAAQTYRQLIRRFPRQPASRIARVSLGTLLLDHLGRPREALALCSAYLRQERAGVVAQEAAYCQIGAYRALGDEARERAAMKAFVSRYPGAVQVEGLRARLQELSGP